MNTKPPLMGVCFLLCIIQNMRQDQEAEDLKPSRRISVFNEEDFEKLKANEKFAESITNSSVIGLSFLVNDTFNDNKCPNCTCPTISNVLDVNTNTFIGECVGCKLQFNITPIF